jgi:hypothetical protein
MSIWKYTWLSTLLPFIIGAVYFRKLNISHRFLYFFVVTGFITELLTQYLRYFTQLQNNMPLGHIYISLSFIFMAVFYLHELKGYINRKVITGVIFSYVIFSIVNIIFFQSYFDYPSTTGAISALILVVFSILLFSKIMKEGKIKILSQSSVIWINTAVLIYYAGSFFFFTLFNLILKYSAHFIYVSLYLFKVLHVLFYLSLAIGLWKAGTNKPAAN